MLVPQWGSQVSTSLTGLQSGRRARAAESARLEIVCCESNRGFKSHRLRGPHGAAQPSNQSPWWAQKTGEPHVPHRVSC